MVFTDSDSTETMIQGEKELGKVHTGIVINEDRIEETTRKNWRTLGEIGISS